MNQEEKKARTVNLTVEIDSPEDIDTTYVNSTRISRFQQDIMIDFGVYNTHEFVSELKKLELEEEPPNAESVDITVRSAGIKRIAMAPGTFYLFRKQIEQIYEAYKNQGLWKFLELES